MKYTLWVMETSRVGTCYVTSVEAVDIEAAKSAAIEECVDNWGDAYTAADVFVLGVAEGDVRLLEWNDE